MQEGDIELVFDLVDGGQLVSRKHPFWNKCAA
jgi:hypothetical protein